jgi:hypothetical protein
VAITVPSSLVKEKFHRRYFGSFSALIWLFFIANKTTVLDEDGSFRAAGFCFTSHSGLYRRWRVSNAATHLNACAGNAVA